MSDNMNLKPEERARKIIDRMLIDAGWDIVSRDDYAANVNAVAIEEGLLKGNHEADYLLYLGGRAIGVLEAKPADNKLGDKVYQQALNYTHSLPIWCRSWAHPLPFVYLSNGNVILFKDTRHPDSEPVELKRMHTPKEIAAMMGLSQEQTFFLGLPRLDTDGLRPCQTECIRNLEHSFRVDDRRRALVVMATGAGKTYTACLASYRLLNYTPIRRILFLVDRTNLGKQALDNGYAAFTRTETKQRFTDIFSVERLRSSDIKDARVTISTIQRLYSLLSGEEITDDVDDDNEQLEPTIDDASNVIEMPAQPRLPRDYFDLIIIDECHRSIYSSWRKVLDYFSSARFIGLTATPVPETVAFFDNNIVLDYPRRQAILDGVNVGTVDYRIFTRAAVVGGTISKGEDVVRHHRHTGKDEEIRTAAEEHYDYKALNRDVVNLEQIRIVIERYRDAIYTQLYPEREPLMDYIPKTLIYALDERHAQNIERIVREVFDKPADSPFVQRITYRNGDSTRLINDFRNNRDFRIAITVTLVATGTDVKPLEVVLFMRDVFSQPLYEQMTGRGVRTIDDELLRIVTPNAHSKDHCYVVDAVGVTTHGLSTPTPGGAPHEQVPSFERILEYVAHSYLPDSVLEHLSNTMSRIARHRIKRPEQQEKFFALSCGHHVDSIAINISNALAEGTLPPFRDVNAPNPERCALVRPLADHPAARDYLLELLHGEITILQPGTDELISEGFGTEGAQAVADSFREYIEAHRDENEALRIIYNNEPRTLDYKALADLQHTLVKANSQFAPSFLWGTFRILDPDNVRVLTRKEEIEAITNVIQLVRYAIHTIERLQPIAAHAVQRFELWCGQVQNEVTREQRDLLRQVVDYIAANGCYKVQDIRETDVQLAAQIVNSFGNISIANQRLMDLSIFITSANSY